MLLDDRVQRVPDLGVGALDLFLGVLDVGGLAGGDERLHHEGLEQLQRHFLRQAALIDFQLGADDDNRAARVVHALAQKVLAEAPLLAAQHLGQRLERAVVRPGDGTAAAAVVDEGVDRLLKHALLVADDDVRRLKLHQALEAVVAVDDAAVKVVQVAGREPAAVELHHRAHVGRDDRQRLENHPLGTVAREPERLDHLQPLDEADLALPLRGLQLLFQIGAQLLEVDFLQQRLNRLGADADGEVVFIFFIIIAVLLLGEKLLLRQRRVAGIDDDILREIQHLFQQLGRDVQQQPHLRGDGAEVPDVRDGRGQLDMAHPLAADLAGRDLDAALFADFALIARAALVFSAVALPVLGRTEDALAEQAVALGLERAVVDRLRLFDFAVGPRPDHIGRCKTDLYGLKFHIFHSCSVLPFTLPRRPGIRRRQRPTRLHRRRPRRTRRPPRRHTSRRRCRGRSRPARTRTYGRPRGHRPPYSRAG